ncbi:SHOCT domain-containing protein [Hutsoniella sourekii]|uniref:SHOCT domain-containing protein n=1 Tax=Hutsoniella sourekii TaxID=87650 RepID=UPI0004ADCB76|nr:SHOCT domain-containing protein [Hutsoniella sourekii]
MVQELSNEEALNEINFIKSLQIINQMKSVGLIDQVEFNKIKVSLIELYKPYLAELML